MTAPTVRLYAVECFGIGCLKTHDLSCRRVLEFQVSAVEGKPADGIEAGAVVFVADNRMALLGQMDAYLVFPAVSRHTPSNVVFACLLSTCAWVTASFPIFLLVVE